MPELASWLEQLLPTSSKAYPLGHSDHLMSLYLPLCNKNCATLISVYAPTLQADPTSDCYNGWLQCYRVGKNHNIWPGVLGRHWIGNCSHNGQLLLELCGEHSLALQKVSFKTTWRHPWSINWHLLEYIIVRQKDIKDVQHTHVMPNADY